MTVVYSIRQRVKPIYVRGRVGKSVSIQRGGGMFDVILGGIKTLFSKAMASPAKTWLINQGKKALSDISQQALDKLGTLAITKGKELATSLINHEGDKPRTEVAKEILKSSVEPAKEISKEVIKSAQDKMSDVISKSKETIRSSLDPQAGALLSGLIAGSGISIKRGKARGKSGKFVGKGLKYV